MKKDFLTISVMTAKEIKDTIDLAIKQKKAGVQSFIRPQHEMPLEGKQAALIFKKPSLRTRVSFEVGVKQLGGHAIYITDNAIGLGLREAVNDAAEVLARYVDLIVIRTFAQEEVEEIARFAKCPVINALTDLHHPCQIMGDAMTVVEQFGFIEGAKIAFVGDGANNIAHSWLDLASRVAIDLRIGTASDRLPDAKILDAARNAGISKITITQDPIEAVTGAHAVYTDVWASMGEKEKAEERIKLLKPFQVNHELMSHADPKVIFLHCLPAERGKEVTDAVMDDPRWRTIVMDEAENRLHIQKAIIQWLFTR